MRKKLSFIVALAAFTGVGSTALAAPEADVSDAAARCSNSYCYSGSDSCELIYNSVCKLSALEPCDNTICNATR